MGSGKVAGVLFNPRGEFDWAGGGPEVLPVTLGSGELGFCQVVIAGCCSECGADFGVGQTAGQCGVAAIPQSGRQRAPCLGGEKFDEGAGIEVDERHRSAPLVADPVRHRPPRSRPGPSRSDGPLRGGLANHAFGRETLQGACAVQRSESRDGNPAVGDDDLTTSPSSIEPIAEVRAQLGHGYIHTVNRTLAEP